MSVYIVITEVPATEIYGTVAATPSEAENNVIQKVGEDKVDIANVSPVATLEGLQMFAEDADEQTTVMELPE